MYTNSLLRFSGMKAIVFRNSGFSKLFTRNDQISVPAFCRTLNLENRTSDTGRIFKRDTSDTGPIFKIQSSTETGTEIYSFLVKYKSFEHPEKSIKVPSMGFTAVYLRKPFWLPNTTRKSLINSWDCDKASNLWHMCDAFITISTISIMTAVSFNNDPCLHVN